MKDESIIQLWTELKPLGRALFREYQPSLLFEWGEALPVHWEGTADETDSELFVLMDGEWWPMASYEEDADQENKAMSYAQITKSATPGAADPSLHWIVDWTE